MGELRLLKWTACFPSALRLACSGFLKTVYLWQARYQIDALLLENTLKLECLNGTLKLPKAR